MMTMGHEDWKQVIQLKGWAHITVVDREADSLSLAANLADCEEPRWCSAEDLPYWVLGVACKEVPWLYTAQGPQTAEYPPHVVYFPQRNPSSMRAFASLHQRFQKDGVALKCETAASTPNVQIAVILVAGRTTAKQLCLYGYFLPFKPNHDVRSGEMYNVWLERRLGERRGRDKDVLAWKKDQLWLDRRPESGLPVSEQLVAMYTYHHNSSTSRHRNGARMHCCLVQSVLPDRTFTYAARPWRQKPDDPAGTLEPDTADQQDGFLKECNCTEAECGKLRAREELRRLRTEGVQYELEVRLVPELHGTGGHGELGVFAGQDIPVDTYLFEYVGEWLSGETSVRRREAVYEPAGLHYLYDLVDPWDKRGKRHGAVGKKKRRCRATGEEDDDHAADHADDVWVVDATHLGNVGRFVNHRCDGANLCSVNVCMGGLDYDFMAIIMRTTRAIRAGEQLTLDYQAGLKPEEKAKIRSNPDGLIPCRCDAASCLGFVFPKVEKKGEGSPEGTRRTAGGACSWPTGVVGATASPAASSSSGDSAGASSSGGAAAMTAATAAVAAGGLAAEGPSSGISGFAAARAAEEAGLLGQRTAAEEEDSCTSAVAATSQRLLKAASVSSGGGAAAPAAGTAGLGAAAAVPGTWAQECGCGSAADKAGASPGVGALAGVTAAAATTGAARRPDALKSSGRLIKRQRLVRPSQLTEPHKQSPGGAAEGGAAAAAATTTEGTAAMAGATALTPAAMAGVTADGDGPAVAGVLISMSSSSGGRGQSGAADTIAPSGTAACCSTGPGVGAVATAAAGASDGVPFERDVA